MGCIGGIKLAYFSLITGSAAELGVVRKQTTNEIAQATRKNFIT
jgi:hypothetical protein